MQLVLGRGWVLEIRVNLALRKRIETACGSLRTPGDQCLRGREAALRWERDKAAGMMMSSWDEMYGRR